MRRGVCQSCTEGGPVVVLGTEGGPHVLVCGHCNEKIASRIAADALRAAALIVEAGPSSVDGLPRRFTAGMIADNLREQADEIDPGAS